jgi:hypothetical protein
MLPGLRNRRLEAIGEWRVAGFFFNFVKERLLTFFFIFFCNELFLDFEIDVCKQ